MEHTRYMCIALEEARKAYRIGEVPVGAAVVFGGDVVARAHDLRESLNDASAHAEILAMREAAQMLSDWRLNDAALYVTMEPCAMCAGAIVQYRVGCLIYGARNEKSGSVDSVLSILQQPKFNHRVEVISGVLEEECRSIIKNFFKQLRSERWPSWSKALDSKSSRL